VIWREREREREEPYVWSYASRVERTDLVLKEVIDEGVVHRDEGTLAISERVKEREEEGALLVAARDEQVPEAVQLVAAQLQAGAEQREFEEREAQA
jgi:hypothetical protein